jgi:hypothetical protein
VDAGNGCVNLALEPGDLACKADSDCTETDTGLVCPSGCRCGGTAANLAAAARISAAEPPATGAVCPCPAFGTPRCVGGQCTLCGFGPGQPAGCAPDAGKVCVTITATAFDQSCTQASDCVPVDFGTLCDGSCRCGLGGFINASALPAYDQAVSGVQFSMMCGCPAGILPACYSGVCSLPGG